MREVTLRDTINSMKFYKLKHQPNYPRHFANSFGESDYGPRCAACGRPPSGPIPPLKVRFEKRVDVADFISAAPEMLAVDEVKRAFEADGVKGIEYLDVIVRVVGTREKLRSKLWHLRVHHAAHAAPQMKVVAINRCASCGFVEYSSWRGGVIIDEGTWDGSDMFRLYEDVVGVIVTEKFVRIVEREGFTGLQFTPAEDYSDPFPQSRPVSGSA